MGLIHLPLYSPELNPMEYFSGILEGEIQRGVPQKSATDSRRAMVSQSRRIQRSPVRVRASSKHRDIKYAT